MELPESTLDQKQINEMEERRIAMLDEAGIDEGDVLGKARDHQKVWENYFNENIVRGKDDVNFVMRDQWTAVERSEFSRLFKPAMTFNKLYDAVKKVIGEQRKNKPDLIVRSLTGKASQEQINLRADLVRTIAYQSQNDLIYQAAFKSALTMGFGAFQIGLEYESPMSFNQVIRYNLIPDPTKTSFDPTAMKPHKGDGNWCTRAYVMTKEEFSATFPYVLNPVSFHDPRMLMDFQWETRDTIVLCDEYVKEWFSLIIYKVKVGDKIISVNEQEYDDLMEAHKIKLEIAGMGEARNIVEKERPIKLAERQTQDYNIMQYRMLQNQIVDFMQWPSKQLPIVFVDGDSYFIEGRQYTRSFIHEARDAQKCVNYFGSEIAAEVKNRRREQWIGTPDNIIGYEQDWRNPELQMGMLRAKPDPKTGQMPQKMPAWELSQGLVMNFQRAGQDIREILGMTEQDQLQGKDISGKARQERKIEASMSTYVFFDNLNQAIEQGGRVVNDLLPYVIGEDERHMIISKKDGKTKPMVFNKMKGGELTNQLEKGDFDVEIDTGPSFAVQKQIALEFFQETLANNPQVFNLVADLWAGNLDIQQMQQVKDRLKTLVPPEILAKEEGTPPPSPKPDPQAMMMQAEIQAKMGDIENKKQLNAIKAQELQLKREKQELEQAELLLKAQKDEMEAQLNVYDHKANIEKTRLAHGLDHHKANLDFTHKATNILSNIYQQEKQHDHEKHLSKEKPAKPAE